MDGLPAVDRRSRRTEGAELPSDELEPEEQQSTERGGGRGLSLRLLANLFIGTGVNHFVMPRAYEAIVPPQLKGHAKRVVQISGVAEVAGGVGVLVPATRRLSGLGLIALLAAVFPANVYMAREPEHFRRIPRWALYGRLPLQPLMMLWAWRATRR
jgi:uncharacterized membrane protein